MNFVLFLGQRSLSASAPRLTGVSLGLLTSGLVASGLAGCSWRSTVQAIRDRPQRQWFEASVRLQGKVSDRVPLLQGQVYQLTDATGNIWVLSPNTTFQPGDQVKIRGTVRFESILIDGQEQGEAYIEEQEQLEHNGNKP